MRRTRLAASALFVTAVMAVGASGTEGGLFDEPSRSTVAEGVDTNPHRPPQTEDRDHGAIVAATPAEERRRQTPRRPPLAPRFEWDAIWAARLRHALDASRDADALGDGRRRERLVRSQPPSYLRFGSGTHQAGPFSPSLA